VSNSFTISDINEQMMNLHNGEFLTEIIILSISKCLALSSSTWKPRLCRIWSITALA